MNAKISKRARQKLRSLGITEDDPRYAPRSVEIRYKTVLAPKQENRLTKVLAGLSSTEFVTVPICEMVNPFRRLFRAMVDGTYSERLRLQVEQLVAPREEEK